MKSNITYWLSYFVLNLVLLCGCHAPYFDDAIEGKAKQPGTTANFYGEVAPKEDSADKVDFLISEYGRYLDVTLTPDATVTGASEINFTLDLMQHVKVHTYDCNNRNVVQQRILPGSWTVSHPSPLGVPMKRQVTFGSDPSKNCYPVISY
ncbi:hypothetical protein GC194_10730 [bacterium]|nr:hypothetical protein [bacterium]